MPLSGDLDDVDLAREVVLRPQRADRPVQVVEGEVGVTDGRSDAGMSEQALDDVDVDPGTYQFRRIGVPPLVRVMPTCHLGAEPGEFHLPGQCFRPETALRGGDVAVGVGEQQR
jgi:hypothetical protein